MDLAHLGTRLVTIAGEQRRCDRVRQRRKSVWKSKPVFSSTMSAVLSSLAIPTISEVRVLEEERRETRRSRALKASQKASTTGRAIRSRAGFDSACGSSASFPLPRWSAALTAPGVVASISAVSSSVNSNTSFKTIAARSWGARRPIRAVPAARVSESGDARTSDAPVPGPAAALRGAGVARDRSRDWRRPGRATRGDSGARDRRRRSSRSRASTCPAPDLPPPRDCR